MKHRNKPENFFRNGSGDNEREVMTDAQAAAERLTGFIADPGSILMPDEIGLDSDIVDAVEVILDAYLAAPRWHDRPTCPGLWVHPACDGWGNLTADTYEESDVSYPASYWDNGPYFGPLPAPPAKDAE